MTNSLVLLKAQLLSFMGINEAMHTRDKTKRINSILVMFAMIVVGAMIFGYSFAISSVYAKLGLLKIVPAYLIFVISVITILFTILKSSNILFGYKDYDMVMSLPVSTKEIILSRILTMYVINIIVDILAVIPVCIVFAMYGEASVWFFAVMAISIFIIPLIPMTISCILGALLTYISTQTRFSNLLYILFYVAIMALSLILPFISSGSSEADLYNIGKVMLEKINSMYPIAGLFTDAVIHKSITALIMFILISVVSMYLFIAILSKYYKRINTNLMSHRTHANYKMGSLDTNSPFMALYKKELKTLFSIPLYLLNTCIGLLIMIAIVIIICIVGTDKVGDFMEIYNLSLIIQNIAPIGLSLILAMSSTSASAISLESRRLYILKSLPVSDKTIYNSKLLVNLTTTVPVSIICSAILSVYLKLSIINCILIFITPIVYSVFISVTGLLMNLRFPKLEFSNVAEVVKQSASVGFTLLIGALSTLIPIALMILLSHTPPQLVTALATLLIGTLSIIFYIMITRTRLNTIE